MLSKRAPFALSLVVLLILGIPAAISLNPAQQLGLILNPVFAQQEEKDIANSEENLQDEEVSAPLTPLQVSHSHLRRSFLE